MVTAVSNGDGYFEEQAEGGCALGRWKYAMLPIVVVEGITGEGNSDTMREARIAGQRCWSGRSHRDGRPLQILGYLQNQLCSFANRPAASP